MKEGQGSRPSLRELASQKVVNLNEFVARREALSTKQQVETKPKPELFGEKITYINEVRYRRNWSHREKLLLKYLTLESTPEEVVSRLRARMSCDKPVSFDRLVLEPKTKTADSEKRSVIEIMTQDRGALPRAGELLHLHFKKRGHDSSYNSTPGGNEEQAKDTQRQYQEKTTQSCHNSQDESYWYETDWRNRPYEELVSNIRRVLVQKRAEYDKDGYKFDPAVWIGESLSKYSFGVGTWGLPAINRPALNVERAWDAISLPHIKSSDYRDIVKSILISHAAAKGRAVILEPKVVKLIDAMAEAVGISRPRGEVTFDLLQNVRLAEMDEASRLHREAANIILDHFRHTGKNISVNGVCFHDVCYPRGIRPELMQLKPRHHELKEGGAEPKRLKDTLDIKWEEDIHHRPPILSPELFEAALKVGVSSSPRLTISEKIKRFIGQTNPLGNLRVTS